MIMEKVRSVTKYFIWFAAIAFVLSMMVGVGTTVFTGRDGKDNNIIARVNNESISINEYSNIFRTRLQSINGPLGIDPIKQRQISEAVINQLISNEIIDDLMERRGISISDEQLTKIVIENPPPTITQNPNFWVNEQFDYDRYYELLNDPRADQFIKSYIAQIEENLPMSILRGEVLSTVRVTSSSAIERFLEDSVEARIEYIKIPLTEWKNTETSISPEEFFEEHKEMFRRNGSVKLGYVFFPVSISDDMIETTKELAGSIINRAKTDSFEILASQYSYLPQDRNLLNGWIGVKNLTYKFAKVVSGMREGEISKPIETSKGFHILKLRERKRDSIDIVEILLPVFPSHDEFESAEAHAWKLINALRDSSDFDVADEYDIKYISYKKAQYPNLSVNFGTFLNDTEEGKVSYPLIGEDGLYVCWVEEKEESIPAFPDIKEEVEDSLINFEAAIRAKEYVLKTLTGDKLPRNPEKGKWGRTPYFTLGTFKSVNVPEKIALLTFSIRREGVLPPVMAGEYLYVTRTIDFKMPDTEKLQEVIPRLALSLQQEKEARFFQKWFNENREKYEVVDLREKLYE
jgi:hypothetical protein